MNSQTTFVRDVLYVAVAQICVAFLNFVRLPIISKELGPELYGTWSLVFAAVTLVAPLSIFGLNQAMIRMLSKEEDKEKIRDDYISIVTVVLLLSSIFSCVMLAGSIGILSSGMVRSFVDIDIGSAFKLGSFMVLTHALSAIVIVYFNTFRKMKLYSFLLVGKAACELILIALFIKLGFELNGVIIAVLISGTITIVVSLLIVLKEIGVSIPRLGRSSEYMRYGFVFVPMAMVMWMIASSNKYMIEYFMGPSDVGIYSAAYSMCLLMSLFLSPIIIVLFPTISKTYDNGEIEKTKNYFKYAFKYFMFFVIPGAFGVAVLAEPLLSMLTTGDFIDGATVVPFIAASFLLLGFYHICAHVLYLTGDKRRLFQILFIVAIMNFFLNLFLIPKIGINGAGLSLLLSHILLAILAAFVAFRRLRFDLSIVPLSKFVFSAIVMICFLSFFNPVGVFQIFPVMFMAFFIYLLFVYFLGGFDVRDIDELRGVLRSRLN